MNIAQRSNLAVEALEDRTVPTTWGVPWVDPGHLTLSFAPDGTQTPAGNSTLSSTMAAAGNTAAWQREILRAFQTWAVNANLNIGLVGDGGQPLGAPGAVQGDARFGDIRVAAAPTSADDELATAAPFSWTGTTYSGDVVFNNADPVRIGNTPAGNDLFSVAAHEAGHVFGLDHSADPASVMQPNYAYHTGLSASDVANIQALYGARSPDAFDAARSNGTLATASALPKVPGRLSEYAANGDVSSSSDVDYYKVTAPLGAVFTSVRLHAEGLSLLAPSVTVYDALGHQIATAASTDPTNNDLSFTFLSVLPTTYYIKVAGATKDVFGIGSYQLVVDTLTSNLLTLPPLPTLLPPADLHTNDTLATADAMTAAPAVGQYAYSTDGVIEDARDVDVYKVKAGTFAAAGPVNLNAMVWGTGSTPLDPRLRVYDQAGNPVAFQVLANDAGVMSIQVANVTPGATYYVAVAARTPGGANDTGGYVVTADFNQGPLTTYDSVAGNSLAAGATDQGTLAVNQAGLYQFALTGVGGGGVTMTVLDASGNVVVTLGVDAGQPAVTGSAYLAAGTYTVQYAYRSTTGTVAPIQYGLFLQDLDDAVGPMKPSGGSSGPSGAQSSGYTYTATSSNTQSTSYGYSF